MRKLIATALAAGTLGGMAGALATAATDSQASPRAIAAAVKQVQDRSAERSLKAIAADLRPDNHTLSSVLANVEQNLFNICLNTNGGSAVPVTCDVPNIYASADQAGSR